MFVCVNETDEYYLAQVLIVKQTCSKTVYDLKICSVNTRNTSTNVTKTALNLSFSHVIYY
jgi:hypothetical protein